jgi:hypothetical protein
VVERSAVEEYSLDEPIGTPHSRQAAAGRLSEAIPDSRPDSGPDFGDLQPADIQRICVNPLADEPHPTIVHAVKRFGVVGLVACALGTGLMRWWRSLAR